MSDSKKTKRQQAFEIYKEHDGNIDLIEIARLLDGPPGTVRGWKSKDKWDKKINGTFQGEKRNVPEKAERSQNNGGAPFGNQNAKGNKGNSRASPPMGNKNAVVTGEYETLLSQYMSEEEKNLFFSEVDSRFVLTEQIQLMRVKQARMLKRLKSAENGLNDNERTVLYELRARQALVEAKGKKIKVDAKEDLVKTEEQVKITPKIDNILRIDDALTRVSAQLVKLIKQLEELDLIKARTNYTKAQTEKALLAKDRGNSGDEEDQTVINIIDDLG